MAIIPFGPVFHFNPASLNLNLLGLSVVFPDLPNHVTALGIADLEIGILFYLALTGVSVYGIVLAGWASNNKWSLFGAMRSAAQVVSYEIPIALTLLAVVMIVGSFDLQEINRAQSGSILNWFVFQKFPFLLIAGLIYFVASIAEVNRTPFDIPEAESELVAGYHTEYSGVKFALIQAAEFGGVVTASMVVVTLFLGGWAGPLADYLGWFWFLLKVGPVAFIFIWVRATYPRLRIDQLMAFAWKFLLPLSIINLFATALEVFFLRDSQGVLATNDLWIMTGINLALGAGWIALFGSMIREKIKPVTWQPAGGSASIVVGEVT